MTKRFTQEDAETQFKSLGFNLLSKFFRSSALIPATSSSKEPLTDLLMISIII